MSAIVDQIVQYVEQTLNEAPDAETREDVLDTVISRLENLKS